MQYDSLKAHRENCAENLQICYDLTFAVHMVDCFEKSVNYHWQILGEFFALGVGSR